QVPGGGKRAAVVRIVHLERGLGVAGDGVDRLEAAVEPLDRLGAAAGEALTRFRGTALVLHVLLLDGLEGIAALDRGNEYQTQLRIVGRRLPVLAADVRRASTYRRLAAHAMRARGVDLDVGVGVVVERPPRLGVEARRPVQLVHVLLAGDERAVGAV